jgi:hypothetical protein
MYAKWTTDDVLKLAKPIGDDVFTRIETECQEVLSILKPWIRHTEHDRAKLLDRIIVNLAAQYPAIMLHSERPFSSTYEKANGRSGFLSSGRHEKDLPLSPIFELKTDIVPRNHLGQLLVMLNAAAYINWAVGYSNMQKIYGILTDVTDYVFVQYDVEPRNGTLKHVQYSQRMLFPKMISGVDRDLCEILNGILSQLCDSVQQGKVPIHTKLNPDIKDLRRMNTSNVVAWMTSKFPETAFPPNMEQIILDQNIDGEVLEIMTKDDWVKLGFTFGTGAKIWKYVQDLLHKENESHNTHHI